MEQKLNKWRFHGSDVNLLIDEGNSIVLELGNVKPEIANVLPSSRIKVKIIIQEPQNRTIEGQSCDVFSFMFDDGEVVFVEIKDDIFSAVIIWTDFKPKPVKNLTLSYKVKGKKISIFEVK